MVVIRYFLLIKCDMIRKFIAATCMFLTLSAVPLPAQELIEQHLPLNGQIAPDGRAVHLDWFDTPRARRGTVRIKRRLFGQMGADSWAEIVPAAGQMMQYTDKTTHAGVAYEYQVMRLGRDIIDVGYWATGRDVPAQARRGRAYIVVDETVAADIQARLTRFERDLTGDGWRVFRTETPRGQAIGATGDLRKVATIKNWLRERYTEDPEASHAVILVGHVPVVISGRANPDGHQAVPHATDLIYGDVDGKWSISPEGALLDTAVPGDFIEMQVGRIDFSNVAAGDRDREVHLLRAYLDKTHHWRMGMHGDLREAYGQSGHLTGEIYGLRNIVGPGAVTTGGHHDVGEEKPWLWGVDFGHFNGQDYAKDYANKAVFAINFGSGKQKFSYNFNAMTALLAQPWYTIAVGWGARPAWWPHHMALGGTIGEVHMRTLNNGRAAEPYRDTMEYFPTGRYLWRNPIWVNLLGDPTTHAFVLAPPSHVSATATDQGTAVSWTASADQDVLGYRVYRQAGADTEFSGLTTGDLVTGTTFRDADPVAGARYMVRAYGLKQVYAGSFYTFSQGAFADVGAAPLRAQDMAVSTPENQPIALPFVFSQPVDGVVHAFVAGPDAGDLTYDGTQWHYTPPPDFSGSVLLRFTVSGVLQTDVGVLTITVGG